MSVLDAIQYLKNNKFTENSQYEWINPILRKVIRNVLSKEDINNLICSITKAKTKLEDTPDEISVASSNNDDCLSIAMLKEICEVKNYGLVDLQDPIKLNPGLNIFYGKNGVGKSSLYKALCSVLGVENFKKCTPNINKKDNKMSCRIKAIDKENKEISLEFCNNSPKPTNVKIFDNYISNYIISNDQKNDFQIPYLKQEYFYILRDVLDQINEKLTTASSNFQDEIYHINELLGDDLEISDMSYKEIEKLTEGVQFNEEDYDKLNKLEKDKSLLESDTSNILKKSYKDRLDEVFEILNELCNVKDKDGNKEYTTKFDKQYLNDYNEELKEYYATKKLYEDSNIKNLSSYIPEDWLIKKQWEKFIEAGINFVRTLNSDDKFTYSNEKCPYCNQDLEGKSKKLVQAYQNIKNTYKEKMNTLENKFALKIQALNDFIVFIDKLEKFNSNINETLFKEEKENCINVDIKQFKAPFDELKSDIESLKEINDIDIEYYQSITMKYVTIQTLIDEKVKQITNSINNKSDELKKIIEEIKRLKLKQKIVNSFDKISKVIENLKIIEDIDKKNNHLVALKKSLSRLENSFSKDSTMKLFIDKLHDEYKQLDLIPPVQLNIKPQKDKRQCKIGDYKISDIYSEGELKIHSLAEFFAETEINNFKGVYFFDDPVNSLDYERIEYVKNRILKLREAGNQIIVFTHNIYFLNSLIPIENYKVNTVIKANNQVVIINETILASKDKQIKEYSKKIDQKMDQFKNMKPIEIDENDMASVYDLISGCLESFVENKLLKDVINRYRPNIRMYSLIELKKLDDNLIDDVYNLYNNTSRYGNRHSSPIEALPPTYDKLKADYNLFKEIISVK